MEQTGHRQDLDNCGECHTCLRPIPKQPLLSSDVFADLFSEVESNKLLLFFEIEPMSDKYQQVMLTREQFIRFNKFVFEELLMAKEVGPGRVILTAEDMQAELPNARPFFEEDEMEQ